MDNLWLSISRLALESHPERIKEISRRFEKMNSIDDLKIIKPFADSKIEEKLIEEFIVCWKNLPEISPLQVSAALQSAAASVTTLEKNQQIELVWTGPDSGLVPSRSTEQVLFELISLANNRLFLVSYVSYNVEGLISILSNASDKGVQINMLLEPSIEHGGKINHDSTKPFIDNISGVNVFVWDKERSDNRGVVHAKCAVADNKIAFITSANLTTAAMEYNMELGLLIKGGTIPTTLDRHFNALIETGVIKPL